MSSALKLVRTSGAMSTTWDRTRRTYLEVLLPLLHNVAGTAHDSLGFRLCRAVKHLARYVLEHLHSVLEYEWVLRSDHCQHEGLFCKPSRSRVTVLVSHATKDVAHNIRTRLGAFRIGVLQAEAPNELTGGWYQEGSQT